MTKRNIVISIFIATVIVGSVFVPRIALAAGSCGGAETSVISCEGEGSTAIINIIKQVIKRIIKNFSVSQIATDLLEPLDTIQPIYDLAMNQAPDFDAEKILKLLHTGKI